MISVCILLQAKLTKKFRVQGIPKLVLIDSGTGKVITHEGYSCVINDKDGQEFPWRPKKFHEVIQGRLLSSDKKEVDALESLKGRLVCLYFSAHWVRSLSI
jgi:nucleoredoxin